MKLQKEITLNTHLQVEEITEVLNSVTEKFYTETNNFKFEGKILSNEFKILPTFNYGARNQLRPQINGKIYENVNGSTIKLSFSLPEELKLLMIFTLILNSFFTIYLYIKPINNFITWYFILLFMILTFIIFYIVYNSKVEESIKVISKILEAKNN